MEKMEKKASKKPKNQGKKLLLVLLTLFIIYLAPYIPTPTLSFNSTLFQSAFFSLIALLFWIGAYHFIKPQPKSQAIVMKKHTNHPKRKRTFS